MDEKLIAENEAYRLTTHGLSQPGLEARMVGRNRLQISQDGKVREVEWPSVSPDCVRYVGDIPVLTAAYEAAIHELHSVHNARGQWRAGASWDGVWTRDVAFAAALGGSIADPEACLRSLEARIRNGVIVQDTGTGGGWPVSTDRVAWALGAWALYIITGNKEKLEEWVDVLENTLMQDEQVLPQHSPLRPGETSFIDWREQSYPDWMTPSDIASSYAFGTNVLHYLCRRLLLRMLEELGRDKEAQVYEAEADSLAEAIEKKFWVDSNNSYAICRLASGYLDTRTDALATALAILIGLAGTHAERALYSLPRTPFGTPVFAPYKQGQHSYHNRAIWPFVESYVLMAHAEILDLHGVEHSMASLLRAFLAFGTNKENFHAEDGTAQGTIQNSDAQLWSSCGMLGMFYYGLFGIHVEGDNLVFIPCVPQAYAGSHWLTGLRIRNMRIDVHLKGYGTEVYFARVNGKPASHVIPMDTEGYLQIELELIPAEDGTPAREFLRATEDLAEPRWNNPTSTELHWHPVPGANTYCIFRDGAAFTTTTECHCRLTPATVFHEYTVQAMGTHATSCISQPFECPVAGSVAELHPHRIGEEAEYTVEHQRAWLDTRPCTARLDYTTFIATQPGTYRVQVLYCNATASLRDADTCAIRELMLNGEPIATVIMPHNTETNRWDDYTWTAPIKLELPAGPHCFSLRYTDNCRNTNGNINQCMVRSLKITKI